jgi:hypothetical protein
MPYETEPVKDRAAQANILAYPTGRFTVNKHVMLEADRLTTVETAPSVWIPSQPVDVDELLRLSPNYGGEELPGLDQ